MSLLVVLLAVAMGYASVVGFAGAVVGCVSSCVMVSLSSSCRYELPVDGSLYATYALLATLRYFRGFCVSGGGDDDLEAESG